MEKEILYRAINNNDYNDYLNNKDIECILLRTNRTSLEPRIKNYYNLCINGIMANALDTIGGHVLGHKIKRETSCFISTTSNFDIACTEYAIPQAGNYNHDNNRKNVIVLEVEKDKILSEVDEIKDLRNQTNIDDMIIDLRNGKLEYYYNRCILSETYNPNMPGYNLEKDSNRVYNGFRTEIPGISNYSKAVDEVVFYKQIRKELIKKILYPLEQDILYGCNNPNINIELDLLEYASKKIDDNSQKIFDEMYPTIQSGNNLTDILLKYYDVIPGNNISEKYYRLKGIKKHILQEILSIINKEISANYQIDRLVDNKIGVCDMSNYYNDFTNISEKDIILVENNGNIYKYSHDKGAYIYSDDIIKQTEVRTLIKKKSR